MCRMITCGFPVAMFLLSEISEQRVVLDAAISMKMTYFGGEHDVL